MWWQEIIGIKTGNSSNQPIEAPAILAAIFFYISAFLVCYITFRLSTLIFPKSVHSFSTEFIKTLLICTYPYGHGLIRQYYGNIGFFVTVVPLMVLTLYMFPQGQGSPLSIFVEFLKGRISVFHLLFSIIIQTLGAFTSYKLALFVWSFKVHPDHTSQLSATMCQSDLNVTVQVGCVLELLCVAFDTWLNFQKLSRNGLVDSIIKISNCTLMVCLGIHLTGMYLHPAMASALTFSCHGSSAFDHIAVYWVSSFIGCYLGYTLHDKVTLNLFSPKVNVKPGKHLSENGKVETKKIN